MRKIKIIPTLMAKALIVTVYNISVMLFHIKEKKITFASYRSEGLTGNLLYVHNQLMKDIPNYHCYFLFKTYSDSLFGKIHYLFHLLRASYHLATSKYFFIDDYYFPVYVIKPRKGTEIIQLWHAAGAFKKFGYSTIGKSFGPSNDYLKHVRVHSNYSKVMVSSSAVIPFYAEAFNMNPDRILPLGIPRTDYFFEKEKHLTLKNKFYEKYTEIKGKKIILYAPTFRGDSHHQEQFDCPIDFGKLKDLIGDKYIIIVHLHPYIKNDLIFDDNVNHFVYQIRNEFSINELMVISDMLITDYSSVIFEYSLLCRPMAFFATDLNEYILERDFYYDYNELIPGPFFSKTNDLARWINMGVFNEIELNNFRNCFFDTLDGKSSERIVNSIIKKGMGVKNKLGDIQEKRGG